MIYNPTNHHGTNHHSWLVKICFKTSSHWKLVAIYKSTGLGRTCFWGDFFLPWDKSSFFTTIFESEYFWFTFVQVSRPNPSHKYRHGTDWLGSPPFISHFHGHLEGVPQPYLGDLNWDNPPSKAAKLGPYFLPWSSAIWKGSHNQILRGLAITMGQLTTYMSWDLKTTLKYGQFFCRNTTLGGPSGHRELRLFGRDVFCRSFDSFASGKCLGWDCKLMGRCSQMFDGTWIWVFPICLLGNFFTRILPWDSSPWISPPFRTSIEQPSKSRGFHVGIDPGSQVDFCVKK